MKAAFPMKMEIFLFRHFCALGFLGTNLVGFATDAQTGTFGKLQLKIANKPDPRGGVLMEFRDGLGKTAIRVEEGSLLSKMVSPDGKLLAVPVLNELRILDANATTRDIKENNVSHSYTFFEWHVTSSELGSKVSYIEVGGSGCTWQDNGTIAVWTSERENEIFRLVRIDLGTGKASVNIERLKHAFQIRDFNKPIEVVFSGENRDSGKPAERPKTGNEPAE